jgi:hypothetical protein
MADFKSIDAKIDKMAEDIGEVKVTQAEQKVILSGQADQLKEHIRRTELAESRIDKHEKAIWFLKGAVYTFTVLAGLAGLAAAIWQAYKS